jgi:hypothetical protein
MPARTSSNKSRMNFVVDQNQMARNAGRQVDWSRVAVAVAFTDAAGKKFVPAGTVLSETGKGKAVPFKLVTLTSVVVASNVATATLTAHGFVVGDVVDVAGGSLAYANGRVTITTVPTANTFTYAATGADATATGTITATLPVVGLIQSDAHEGSKSDSLSGYGVWVGGVVYENLLPDSSLGLLPSVMKAGLQAAGVGFVFEKIVFTGSV